MSEPLYFNHTQDTSKNLEFIINQFKDFSSSNSCQSLLKQNNLSVIDSFSKWKMERIKEEDEKKKKNNIKKSSPVKQNSDILIQHMLNSKKYEQDKKKELEKKDKNKEKDKEKEKEKDKEDIFIKNSITNPNDNINIINNCEKNDKLEKMNQEISSKLIMEIDEEKKRDEDIFDSSIEKKNSEYGKDEDDIFKLDDDNYDDIFDSASQKDVFENSKTQKIISPKQSLVSNNHDMPPINNSRLSNSNIRHSEYIIQEGNKEKEKEKEQEQLKIKEFNKSKDINKIVNNKIDNEKAIEKFQVIEKPQDESQNGKNKNSILPSHTYPSQKIFPSHQSSQQIEKKETPKTIPKIDDSNDNMLMKLQKIEKELSFMDSESDINTSQKNPTIQNKANNKILEQSNILKEKDRKNNISSGMTNYNFNNIKKINENPKIPTLNNMTAPRQVDKIPGNSTNTTQTNVNHLNQIAVLNNKRVLLDEEEEEELEKERKDDLKSKSDTNSFRNKLVEISDTRIKIFFDSDIKEHMNQKSVAFIKNNNEDTLNRDKNKHNEMSLPLKEEKNHIKMDIKRNPIKIKSPENVKINKFSNSSLLINKTTNALDKNNSIKNKTSSLTNQNQSDYSKNRNKNNIINEKSETSKESISFSTRTYANDNDSLFNRIESYFKALKKAIQNLIIEELDKEDFTLSFDEILTNIKVLKEKEPSPINTFIKCSGFMNMCLKVINSCPIGRSCKNSLFSYVSLFI